eukprot:TRINITY_DN7682_c0_g1_i2.p1 TRINITY_DN7682_c0_g1~~TRINITY_DN7682_c0_g1_i2.p1  ORF type:complete len:903 (+),score=213.50 TRINITY_DN7682_c0_g1_i2:54-2762(+)
MDAGPVSCFNMMWQEPWQLPPHCQTPMGVLPCQPHYAAPMWGGPMLPPMAAGHPSHFMGIPQMLPQPPQQGAAASEDQGAVTVRSGGVPRQNSAAQKKPQRQPECTSRERRNVAAETARDLLLILLEAVVSAIKSDEEKEVEATDESKALRSKWKEALQEARGALSSECAGQETPEGRALPPLQRLMEKKEEEEDAAPRLSSTKPKAKTGHDEASKSKGKDSKKDKVSKAEKVLGRHVYLPTRVLVRSLRERIVSVATDVMKQRGLPRGDRSRRALFLQQCVKQIGQSLSPNLQSALLQAYHKRHGSSKEDHQENHENRALHREPPLFSSKGFDSQQYKKVQAQGGQRAGHTGTDSNDDGEDCLPPPRPMTAFEMPQEAPAPGGSSEKACGKEVTWARPKVKNTFIDDHPDAEVASLGAPSCAVTEAPTGVHPKDTPWHEAKRKLNADLSTPAKPFKLFCVFDFRGTLTWDEKLPDTWAEEPEKEGFIKLQQGAKVWFRWESLLRELDAKETCSFAFWSCKSEHMARLYVTMLLKRAIGGEDWEWHPPVSRTVVSFAEATKVPSHHQPGYFAQPSRPHNKIYLFTNVDQQIQPRGRHQKAKKLFDIIHMLQDVCDVDAPTEENTLCFDSDMGNVDPPSNRIVTPSWYDDAKEGEEFMKDQIEFLLTNAHLFSYDVREYVENPPFFLTIGRSQDKYRDWPAHYAISGATRQILQFKVEEQEAVAQSPELQVRLLNREWRVVEEDGVKKARELSTVAFKEYGFAEKHAEFLQGAWALLAKYLQCLSKDSWLEFTAEALRRVQMTIHKASEKVVITIQIDNNAWAATYIVKDGSDSCTDKQECQTFNAGDVGARTKILATFVDKFRISEDQAAFLYQFAECWLPLSEESKQGICRRDDDPGCASS